MNQSTVDAIRVSASATITGSTIGYLNLNGGVPMVSGNTFSDELPIRLTDPDMAEFSGFSGNTYSAADPWVSIQGTLDGSRELGVIDGVLGQYDLTVWNAVLTVAAGATLTLGPGLTLRAGYRDDIVVHGCLEVTGATVELLHRGPMGTTVLDVRSGGELSLVGGTVRGPGLLFVKQGGRADLLGVTFASDPDVYFYGGSSGTVDGTSGSWRLDVASDAVAVTEAAIDTLNLSASATVTGGTIGSVAVSAGSPIIAENALGYIILGGGTPAITGNTFTDGSPIRITDPDLDTDGITDNTYSAADPWVAIQGTLDGSRELGLIDGVLGQYELAVGYATLTVAAGATLTLEPGLILRAGFRDYVFVYGRLEATGATVELLYRHGNGNSILEVRNGGELALLGGTVRGPGLLFVKHGGQADFVGVRFASNPYLYFYNGSSGTVEWSTFTASLSVDSDAAVSVFNSDISGGSVSVTGDPLATVDMEDNWWGSTDPAVIEDKITHHPDDASRPWVDYTPWRSGSPLQLAVIDQWPEGRLPQEIDYVEVVFNQEVDLPEFTPDDVLLTGPAGTVDAITIEHLGYFIYRITLAALLTSGDYTLRLGPDILNLAGGAMNQDGDGILGEPIEDVYEGTFTIDLVSPHVVALTPAPQSMLSHAPSAIVTSFDEAIDPSTVSGGTFRLLGSGGDGTFNDGNEVPIIPNSVTTTAAAEATINLAGVPVPNDMYQVTLDDGYSASALSFDGTNDYVRMADDPSLDLSEQFTLEAWIYPRTIAGSDRAVISKIGGAGGGNGYQLWVDANSRAGVQFNAPGEPWTANRAITAVLDLLNKWTHISGTYDHDTLRLYVNGQLLASQTVGPKSVVNSSSSLRISGDDNEHVYFGGLIDEARVWNHARTADEIGSTMYSSLAGTEPGLVGYWDFEEAGGQVVYDRSPNDNDGTLGATAAPGSDDPTWVQLPGYITDVVGNVFDGEFLGGFPSGDGVPGGDFVATFTVNDTVPLRVVQHIPSGDIAGTVDAVDVIFNEQIDPGSFTTADANLTVPGGGTVVPTSITQVTDTRYRVSLPLQTGFGAYVLSVGPAITDRAGNLMDQDGNGLPGQPTDVYGADFSIVDVDLQVSNVTVDAATLWAGEPVTVSWDGANSTGYELLGDWTDAVYLSANDQWDIGDELLATVPHTGGLTAGESYHQSVEVFVPGRLPGDYHVIVRADLYNQEDEGTAEGNNVMALGPLPLDVRPLPADGTAVGGTLSRTDRSDYYALAVGAGESVLITLDSLATGGINELYVGFETMPMRLSYDYKAAPGTQDLELAVPGVVAGGTFYVLAYAAQVDTAASYNLAAQVAEIFFSDVTPRRHGNRTPGTFTLIGLGFDNDTNVVFIGTDSSEWSPTAVHVQSPTVMTVDLDLPTWPADVYDVRVSKASGASEELTDLVTIVEGGLPKLETNLIVPDRLGFHIAATIWIEYANTGDGPMPTPLLRLHGTQDALLTADPKLAGPGLWTADPPEGLSDTVEVLGVGSSATPGFLQPGESGRIPIYYRGLKLPWDFSRPPIEFTLGALTADDATPIHWAAIKDELRPEWMPADGWDAIVENLADPDFVGDTWGNYVTMLADNVNYLHSVRQQVTDIATLWNFEIAQAAAKFTGCSVVDTVDAYSPAAGMPLVFGRSFGDCIAKRYALGPLGRGWTHNWDIRGEGSFALPDGTVWQFRPDGLLDFVQDANGNRISLGYSSGQLTSLTHSNGDQFLLDYNADGRIWHVTDPRGGGPEDDHVTTFEYDPSGEYLLRVTAPGDQVTSYTYETAGTPQQIHGLLSVEYADGTHDYFGYDDHGRLEQTYRDGGAQAVTYSYDSAGTVTVEDATGRQTVTCFGLGGQVVRVRDGEDNVVSLSYDDYQLTVITGGSGEEYRYSYDLQGNLADMEDPLRNHTTFTYPPTLSNPESVTDARGNRILYDYDPATHNLLSITYEDGTIESFTYYADGSVETWTNRRGDTVTYTYCPNGQLKSKDYSTTPGVDYEYVYDEAGNLKSASGPEGTTLFDYYPDTNWLKRVEYAGGQFFEFEYWSSGMRKKRTDQDGNLVNYIPDSVGRLDQMTDGAGVLIVDYDYDPAGRLERKTLGNGVYTTYEYDDAGRLTDLVNYDPQSALVSSFQYTYDASGRRDSMLVQRNPATAWDGTYRYGYDPLGQLTNVTYPDGDVMAYDYDPVGNRIEVVDDGVSTPYVTNEMNQYMNVGGVSYTYDSDGNMISKTEGGTSTTYVYDIENRLTEVATPADTWTYAYDALGNRVASIYNGVTTHYVVDPIGYGEVAAEYDGSGNLTARYDHGLGLVSRTDADSHSAYYTFSAIGNTSEITGSSGEKLNCYAYDPFGIALDASESVANPFQFVGEYGVMHEANGLDFMRARFYDSLIGRLVQQDPIGIAGGLNLYAYVGNDPASRTDPTGLYSSREECMIWCTEFWCPTLLEFLVALTALAAEGASTGKATPLLLKVWKELSEEGIPGACEYYCTIRCKDLPPQEGAPDAPTNRSDSGSSQPVGSFDPNDKLGPTGYGSEHFVRVDAVLPYQTRFENKAEATAPAQKIVVTDTLDDDLDLLTFELTEIAFAEHAILIPPRLNHYETTVQISPDGYDLLVQVEAALDLDTRQLTVELLAVDPATGWLPQDVDLGLLYPNDQTGRGDGHVSYTVKPLADRPSGTQITNQATIIFDFNDPIDTPEVLNTLDAALPASHVLPLPATSIETEFLVEWTGEDEQNGSGLAGYDIYYRIDNESYVLWLDNTTDTSALFSGEVGHTYAYYSIATDNVGHEEAPPDVADATITIVPPLQVEAGPDQTAPEGDLVELADASWIFGGDPAVLTLSVNWGDGCVEPGILVPNDGGGTIANSHRYADDSDEPYVVTLVLSDDIGTTVEDTLHVTVSNAPPVVISTPLADGEEGVVYDLTIDFTDAGTADTHTATIDWGDATVEPGLVTEDSGSGTVSGSHVYADNGPYTVIVTVTDDHEDGLVEPPVTINSVAPTATPYNYGPYDEGSAGVVSLDEPFDPSSADTSAGFTYGYDFNNDGDFEDFCEVASTDQASATVPSIYLADNPSRVVRMVIRDKDGAQTEYTTTITVNNVAPTLGPITAPVDPTEVNVEIAAMADFTDPGILDTHTALWDWGDENTSDGTVTETDGSGSVSGTHVYTGAGVYTVRLTVTDKDGDSDEQVFQYVVVFDPSAGFVTGGGWIDSPEGAFVADPSLTGKANFGFISKYKKGTSVPTGQIQFKFADLKFHSSVYQWLVIAGAQAKFKGTGTINGEGNYGFMVTGLDGQAQGGGGTDKFRMKIWDRDNADTVVYDNQIGDAEDADATTELGGGSIVVHSNPQALHAAGGPSAIGTTLDQHMLGAAVDQAIRYWAGAGVDRASVGTLGVIDVRIADLSGSLLGMASSTDLMWIDRDAAGYGWRIDPAATKGSMVGGMDLLSAVTHEFGHVLGLDHDDPYAVMAATLAPGTEQLAPISSLSGYFSDTSSGLAVGLAANTRRVDEYFSGWGNAGSLGRIDRFDSGRSENARIIKVMGMDAAIGQLFGRSWKVDRDEDDGGAHRDLFGEWADWIGELDSDSEDIEKVPIDEHLLAELTVRLVE